MKDTKAEKGMLKEASSINRSLFTLGKVRSLTQRCDAGPPPTVRGSCCWANTTCLKSSCSDNNKPQMTKYSAERHAVPALIAELC